MCILIMCRTSIILPNNVMLVLRSFTTKEPLTPKTFNEKVNLAPCVISFALRTLFREKVIQKTPDIVHMCLQNYNVNLDKVRELQLLFNKNNHPICNHLFCILHTRSIAKFVTKSEGIGPINVEYILENCQTAVTRYLILRTVYLIGGNRKTQPLKGW